MMDAHSESDLLGKLTDEFLDRYRRGERPDLDEYAQRHPVLAELIREVFPALILLEDVRPDPGHSALREPMVSGKPLEKLGEYRIVREIGRGGMGVVYEAEQEALDRRVALKVLPHTALRSPRQIERFRREARAAARLHHTNIVPVFGVGQDGEILYYVMQYIEGRPLDAVLDELRRLREEEKGISSRPPAADGGPAPGHEAVSTPDDDSSLADVARSLWEGRFRIPSRKNGSNPSDSKIKDAESPEPQGSSSAGSSLFGASSTRSSISPLINLWKPYVGSVASIGIQVADALEYALTQGVLHRDVKPSNLLLDRFGTVWLTDFGLAKSGDSSNLTHTGDLLGTLRYLAPERFRGQTDVRGDIYALGLTLYELLALSPAFQGHAEERLIRQITTDEPARLDSIDPDLPRDLVTIVHKAIAPEPSDRYRTPGALAEDLRRFLDDRPIVARQIGSLERCWRWCRRNPGMAAAVGSAGLALIASAVLALLYANSQSRAAEKITGLAAKLRWSLAESNHRLAILNLERGQLACERGEVDRGLLWMLESLRTASEVNDPALRRAARANLSAWRRYQPELKAVFSHGGIVSKVVFSPDGTKIVTGGGDGAARFWEAATGRPVGIFLQHEGLVRVVAFSPDGKTILTGSQGGSVRLWDATTGQPAGPAFVCHGVIEAMAFSPDGKTVLIGTQDDTARFWDTTAGRSVGLPLQHQGPVRAVAFSPDGKTALTGSDDGAVRLWDAATGRLTGPLMLHQGPVRVAVFSPDGGTVLTGGEDMTARLWNVATGQPIGLPLHHQNWVEAATFSPDGKTVLTGGQDSKARLWDAATAESLGPPLQHQGAVRAVAFSPDGTTALTGSQDGSARLWDVATGRPIGPSLRHLGPVEAVAFNPDGTTVLTGSQDGTARLWSAIVTPTGGMPLQHQDLVRAVAFSPDGKTALTGGRDGVAQRWDVATAHPIGPPLQHQASITVVAFSPDGARIVTGARDGSARLWNAVNGDPIGSPLRDQGAIAAAAFSPDSKMVLTGGQDGTARLYDAATGQPIGSSLRHRRFVAALAFSPDGKTILTGSQDNTARLWDAATGLPMEPPLQHQGWIQAVAFSPDGKLVLTGSDDNTARLWHAATGQPATPPLRHQSWVRAVAFSPDGKLVLTGSDDTTARLWEVATGQPAGPPLRHEGLVRSVAFSPDGTRVVTGGWDGTVRLWDTATARPAGPPLQHQNWVEAVAFSPDGRWLLSGGNDNTARLWNASEFPDDLPSVADSIRVMTGLDLDEEGNVHLLEDEAWRRFKDHLRTSTIAREIELDRPYDPILYGPDPAARARAWRERNHWDAAESAFNQAVAARPLDGSVWHERGQFFADRSQPAKAEADFTQAFILGNRDPALVADVYGLDRAFRHIVALQPGAAPQLWLKRAEYFVQRKAWERAEVILTEGLASYPQDPWLRLTRGRALTELGRPQLAAEDFSRAFPSASDPKDYRRLAREFARLGLREKTALACNKLIEVDPTNHDAWSQSAPLYLQIDDVSGYRKHCHEMLMRFGATRDPVVAERTAKACLLSPLPECDSEIALHLAERAVEAAQAQDLWHLPYCRMTRALAEYRCGRYEAAVAWSEKCLAQKSIDWNCEIPAHLVQAMAWFRLHRQESARSALLDVSEIIKGSLPKLGHLDWDRFWHGRLICSLLLREAEELILGKPVSTDPFSPRS